MTKVQNPIIGRSRGSAGGMTFAKVYNKNVMKAKIFEATNPNTAAQQTQRGFFRSVSAQVQNFTDEQVRFLFPTMPKSMGRRNMLFKQLAENSKVVEGVKMMKLEDLDTLGNAQVMVMGTTTCNISDNNINVALDASLRTNNDVKDYRFVAAIINQTKEEIILPITNQLVSVGTLVIALPTTWAAGDTVKAIPLISNGKTAMVGFGTMSVLARPERKGQNPRG